MSKLTASIAANVANLAKLTAPDTTKFGMSATLAAMPDTTKFGQILPPSSPPSSS
jgi:hypothetical protein